MSTGVDTSLRSTVACCTVDSGGGRTTLLKPFCTTGCDVRRATMLPVLLAPGSVGRPAWVGKVPRTARLAVVGGDSWPGDNARPTSEWLLAPGAMWGGLVAPVSCLGHCVFGLGLLQMEGTEGDITIVGEHWDMRGLCLPCMCGD
mmetsp:Transcript_12030/g.37650  ORF Transcript_12030/g.37650 Transcript_12030/m.37650 type:complete len:145 (+) Transcript_12030:180-614(+)